VLLSLLGFLWDYKSRVVSAKLSPTATKYRSCVVNFVYLLLTPFISFSGKVFDVGAQTLSEISFEALQPHCLTR